MNFLKTLTLLLASNTLFLFGYKGTFTLPSGKQINWESSDCERINFSDEKSKYIYQTNENQNATLLNKILKECNKERNEPIEKHENPKQCSAVKLLSNILHELALKEARSDNRQLGVILSNGAPDGCKNCRALITPQTSYLSCDCQKDHGFKTTKLENFLNCNELQNCNGSLTCGTCKN